MQEVLLRESGDANLIWPRILQKLLQVSLHITQEGRREGEGERGREGERRRERGQGVRRGRGGEEASG